MWRIHVALTAVLGIAVVVLSTLVIRGRSGIDGPRDPEPVRSGPYIERVTDAETALRKLGYAAWVFRLQGGMLDGELQREPDEEHPRNLGGETVWEDLRRLAPGSPDLSEVSSMLMVVVGSGQGGPVAGLIREETLEAPCRVYLEVSLRPDGPIVIDEFLTSVTFALPVSDSTQADLAVDVFGHWRKTGDRRSADLDSRYTLL